MNNELAREPSRSTTVPADLDIYMIMNNQLAQEPSFVLNQWFLFKSQSFQLRAFKSTEFPTQNLRQIGHGVHEL